MEDTDSLFAIPSSSSRYCYGGGRFRHRSSMASNMSSVSSANPNPVGRAILIVELPAEVLVKILSYLSFNQVSGLRLVSQKNWGLIVEMEFWIAIISSFFSGFSTFQRNLCLDAEFDFPETSVQYAPALPNHQGQNAQERKCQEKSSIGQGVWHCGNFAHETHSVANDLWQTYWEKTCLLLCWRGNFRIILRFFEYYCKFRILHRY